MKITQVVLIACGLIFSTASFSQSKKASKMTTEQKKQLVSKFMELMTTHQSEKFGEVIAENYQQHNPLVKQGLIGIKEGAKWFESIFPDATATTDDIVVEGDKVVARFTWTGTHKGEFFGIPATNKKVTWTGTDWWRVEDGKLAEHWDVVDWASLTQQLQSK
jgi:steroid delta-isomerase-like uncharacterized protein